MIFVALVRALYVPFILRLSRCFKTSYKLHLMGIWVSSASHHRSRVTAMTCDLAGSRGQDG